MWLSLCYNQAEIIKADDPQRGAALHVTRLRKGLIPLALHEHVPARGEGRQGFGRLSDDIGGRQLRGRPARSRLDDEAAAEPGPRQDDELEIDRAGQENQGGRGRPSGRKHAKVAVGQGAAAEHRGAAADGQNEARDEDVRRKQRNAQKEQKQDRGHDFWGDWADFSTISQKPARPRTTTGAPASTVPIPTAASYRLPSTSTWPPGRRVVAAMPSRPTSASRPSPAPGSGRASRAQRT